MIGSGKSSLAKLFSDNGWYIINADKIGNDVVKENKSLLKKLAKEFGKDILTPTGRLRRKLLVKRAFGANSKVKILNRIVHPYLLKELNRQIKHHQSFKRNIVIDAALLLDWDYDKKLDYTITVHSKLELRIKRMKKRGYNSDDIKKITSRQLSLSEFKNRSDFVIYNNGTQKELRHKFENLLKKLI